MSTSWHNVQGAYLPRRSDLVIIVAWPFCPCDSATGGTPTFATEEGPPRAAFGWGQEPVAITKTWQRVEQVELRLRFLLHPFGFGEEIASFVAPAGLV